MSWNKSWVCMLLLVISSGAALASPINLSTWYEFGFDPNHYPLASGCQPADPAGVPCRTGIGSTFLASAPWTFTAATPVSFTITDGLLAGDYFDVLDFGTVVGSTPPVPSSGAGCGLDPNVCVMTPSISHASFLLGSGSHSITILVHPSQILGEGFFRVDAVPEPSTFGYMASILAGIYIRHRFRSRRVQG